MDLTRVALLHNSSDQDLQDPNYVEQLICKLGFNNEILQEQPDIVKANTGGLFIWQYPNQFSKYLCFLRQFKIGSYLEIGCRIGGTFVLTCEYLRRWNALARCTAVDIIDSPVAAYCNSKGEGVEFLQMNSQSSTFQDVMKGRMYDLVLIDGDHTYNGVKRDYDTVKDKANILVFHDIVNAVCPGVVQLWNELKQKESANYEFHEFVEQYPEVLARQQKRYLGIGVAVRKNRFEI